MRSLPTLATISTLVLAAYAQSKTEYDYIICGGGTAGLTVANKLSEDDSVSVLVVDAGTNESPGGPAPDSWNYPSVPQVNANGKPQNLPAGKLVGGTSQINGKVYSRPESSQIDIWGDVNNADWSWNTLLKYYKSSEALSIPSDDQQEAGYTFNPDFHGLNGHVNVSFPAETNAAFHTILEKTASEFDIPLNRDFNGGNARGFATYPAEFVVEGEREQRRWSAREAYYLPAQNRTNLEIIDQTTCLRLAWKKGSSGDDQTRTAAGVEIASVEKEQTIKARKEVILSAGAYRSASILEYSGVGDKTLLSNFSIDSVIDLPGVGENLQDQMQGTLFFNRSENTTITFPTPVGEEITTNFLFHVTYDDVLQDDSLDFQNRINSSLPDYAASISKYINSTLSAEQIQKSLQVQYNNIFNTRAPAVELFTNQNLNSTVIGFEFWPLTSLSRGSVHISGGNPQAAGSLPNIDPNWFAVDYDWDIYIASARFVRKFFAAAPLSAEVTGELEPNTDRVPEDASDDVWKDWWKDHYRAGWHPVGSCAMLPRSWGGVVDADLKVYGTGNVRVVDASVIPFNLGGHPTSTVYALAERAAELLTKGLSTKR